MRIGLLGWFLEWLAARWLCLFMFCWSYCWDEQGETMTQEEKIDGLQEALVSIFNESLKEEPDVIAIQMTARYALFKCCNEGLIKDYGHGV